MPREDPYDPGETLAYECVGCGRRVEADRHPVTCEECGADMRDVSLPRE